MGNDASLRFPSPSEEKRSQISTSSFWQGRLLTDQLLVGKRKKKGAWSRLKPARAGFLGGPLSAGTKKRVLSLTKGKGSAYLKVKSSQSG